MTIDFHSHCFIPDALAERAIAALSRSVEGILSPHGNGTLGNMMDVMERDGIDMAVMLPIATKPSQHGVILRNALSIMDGTFGERARRMVIPFASAHPLDPDLDAHIDEIASHGIKGVKFHPYYQGFSLSDPSVWPMFRKIAEKGLVVQCHCGFDVGYPERHDACGPDDVATLLENVRGLTFVAAHLGGCAGYPSHATDRLLELGCYADTSALERDHVKEEQMRLVRCWPADRLLFGTDFPWTSPARSAAWAAAGRDADEREAVMSGNARRLLQI